MEGFILVLLGTIANAGAIIIGGIAGSIFRKGISKRFNNIITSGLGLFTLGLGITFAIGSQNAMIVIFSLVIGSIIGEWIDIEKRMNDLGNYVQDKLNSKEGNLSKGFVTASLLYCVGTMSIMGPLRSGLLNDHNILLTKSVLDGVTSVVFASTLGMGVVLSFLPVLLYQGSLTLLASYVAPYLSEAVIIEMTAVGGILLVGMGINILEIKRLKVGNMLPAIFLPIILMLFM
ncbi:MAG: DUF554 domain-containing protein [Gracilibacteraceae bacterium]|jgi:uncharacterized membrane protein YqgA involved in biofilm formation|nr:DUF554 domain-containing protein [Gracilibacteraceae bacterium]